LPTNSSPGDEIKKETQMMFLDCPAYLDDEGAARCGLPAEVRCSYTMQSTDGPLDSVMIKCPSGHWFNGPLEFLTWKNGEGQDVGRPFDRGPGSDAMEPASTYTIMKRGAGRFHASSNRRLGTDIRDCRWARAGEIEHHELSARRWIGPALFAATKRKFTPSAGDA
jgi:hypothetical protein